MAIAPILGLGDPPLTVPAPSGPLGVGGDELLNLVAAGGDLKDLLTAIAPQGFGEGDGPQGSGPPTGAGIITGEVNKLRLGAMHGRERVCKIPSILLKFSKTGGSGRRSGLGGRGEPLDHQRHCAVLYSFVVNINYKKP